MSLFPANIVVVNHSTVLQDEQIQAVITAFQAQVTEDWEPHWPGRGATVHFASMHDKLTDGWWPLYILDHTDVPDAGGYHDDDGDLVQGKVFAADAMQYGEAWTVDATHELLEMLGDPLADAIVPVPHTQLHCLQEVCDAVEADQYAYEKMGVLVSDFVLPGYFTAKGGPDFDFRGHLHHHVPALLPGGYLGIELANGQWTQVVKREMRAGRLQMSRRAIHSHRMLRRLADG